MMTLWHWLTRNLLDKVESFTVCQGLLFDHSTFCVNDKRQELNVTTYAMVTLNDQFCIVMCSYNWHR